MSQAQALFNQRFTNQALYSRAFLDAYLCQLQLEFGEPRTCNQHFDVGTAEFDAQRYGWNEARLDAQRAKTLAAFAAVPALPTPFNEGEGSCV